MDISNFSAGLEFNSGSFDDSVLMETWKVRVHT